MCVAAPGKVLSINGTTALIDYGGNKVNAECAVVNAKVGDWVLVHAGLVIQVLDKDEAQTIADLYKELEEL